MVCGTPEDLILSGCWNLSLAKGVVFDSYSGKISLFLRKIRGIDKRHRLFWEMR